MTRTKLTDLVKPLSITKYNWMCLVCSKLHVGERSALNCVKQHQRDRDSYWVTHWTNIEGNMPGQQKLMGM